jgi:RNA polymerase sigma factor (sigma-70 family)
MVVIQRELEARVVEGCAETSGSKFRGHADLPDIVAAAAAGDPVAWSALTLRFGGMVIAIARSCRLNEADVADVHQVTWLRLVEKIDRIEQPERIGAWLATTAKRESLRIASSKNRLTFNHDALMDRPDADAKPPEEGLISIERAEAVRKAFALLPPHCRRLLSVLARDDAPPYKEVSTILSMPIGSIGPTRGRCLEHLRRILDELGAGV